nr:PA-phosphatase [Belliella kenyensis]
MPTLIFAFLLFGLPESEFSSGPNRALIFFVIFANTFVIPLAILMVMKLTGTITSLRMSGRKERIMPFSVISLLYMVTAYAFFSKDWMDYKLVYTLLVITICLVLLTGISFFWKISAHMIGAGGLLGFVLASTQMVMGHSLLGYAMGAVLLVGLVGSSRLYLNTHTPLQVWVGFFVGFLICFMSYFLVWGI